MSGPIPISAQWVRIVIYKIWGMLQIWCCCHRTDLISSGRGCSIVHCFSVPRFQRRQTTLFLAWGWALRCVKHRAHHKYNRKILKNSMVEDTTVALSMCLVDGKKRCTCRRNKDDAAQRSSQRGLENCFHSSEHCPALTHTLKGNHRKRKPY